MNISSPESNHTVMITRLSDGPLEKKLVRVAESVYPSREDISSIYEQGEMPGGNVWWYSRGLAVPENRGEILIPYCITTEAVEHYEALVNDWKQIPQDAPDDWMSSSLEYTATIKLCGVIEETDIYVVEMLLKWRSHGRLMVGVLFEKTRSVILTEDGKVLSIIGDGVTLFTFYLD